MFFPSLPVDFFRDSDVLYFWFINDTSYGNTRSASFLYNFTSPGPSSIEVFVVARKRHNGTNHPNGTHRDWGPWWDAGLLNLKPTLSRKESKVFVKWGLSKLLTLWKF